MNIYFVGDIYWMKFGVTPLQSCKVRDKVWSEGVALLQFVRRETERMKECNILHPKQFEIYIGWDLRMFYIFHASMYWFDTFSVEVSMWLLKGVASKPQGIPKQITPDAVRIT